MSDKKKLPEHAIKHEEGAHVLYREGLMMKTPRDLPLAVPQRKVAEAILQECLAQTEEKLDLRKMPMTQMTLTVIDIASTQRNNIIDGIMRYGDSELVCQRAEEPADLVAEQQRVWQPFIDWCNKKFGVALKTGSGITANAQPPETLSAIRAFVEGFDDYQLVGVSEAVGVSGSLVLGLALATGHADANAVFHAAELDQLWQMRKWGEDPALTSRHADILRDLGDCIKWFSLLN